MSSHNSHPKLSKTNSSSAAATSSSSSACAACKYQRRRCTPDCILAPHFPANNPSQFHNVHRLYGVSNILKILKSVDPSRHEETMGSIIWQSNVRALDPVGGCFGIVLQLKHQIDILFSELQIVLAQTALYRAQIEARNNMITSNEVNHNAAVATTTEIYENMTSVQQQHQQRCNHLFYDTQEEQKSNQLIKAQDNNNNIIANGNGFDMSMNMLGGDMLDMEMIGQTQNFLQEEEMKTFVNNAFEDDQDSKDATTGSSITAIHNSSNTDLKDDGSPVVQIQEHDLKSAASLLTLRNCND